MLEGLSSYGCKATLMRGWEGAEDDMRIVNGFNAYDKRTNLIQAMHWQKLVMAPEQ